MIAGRVSVCSFVIAAAERFKRDFAAAAAGEGPWEFRPDLAERPMVFTGLLPNIKGPMAGRPIELRPDQKFILANLFGFVARGTETRRFRQGIIYQPRGNGKTTYSAPIALYLTFVDGEGGAEGYAAAVTRDQARILFDTAQNMVRRSPEFRSRFGVEVGANAIYQTRTASKFVPVSSDAKALDGLNVQIGICDEIGSHKTPEVYEVLLTAMGKRTHPMLICISTATGNTSGIGKQLWDYVVKILTGAVQDDGVFGILYTIDDDDDPWAEVSWIKANPGWGTAVQPDAIRGIMRQARNNPAQESTAKTKHLNIWVGADDALFSTRAWRECADTGLSMDALEGLPCEMALDLATRSDLAALALSFPTAEADGRITYKVFCRCYLPEAAVMEGKHAQYPNWAADAYLVITPGNETDFATIEADILDFCRRFDVRSVAYDPWGSTQLAQRLQAEGVPMMEFRATTQNFSEPTKELDAAMRGGRIVHDGNPVLEWCVGNVVGRYDARGNVYPRKARAENKIDGAVALIMALARSMAKPPEKFVSIFDRPELWTP